MAATLQSAVNIHHRSHAGLLMGILGMIAFSMTPPATRVSAPELGGMFVGLGRSVIASTLAVTLLWILKEPFPKRSYIPRLLIVTLGVVFGFPILSAIAMVNLPASHAAVVIGLLPAVTAALSAIRNRERLSPLFWISCTLGAVTVIIFAATQNLGHLGLPDLYLLIAVLLGGLGYAEGGGLSKTMGGWRVICWALVLSIPFLIVPTVYTLVTYHPTASLHAWLGFIYLGVISMFLGFFAWYRGLALGGIARIAQVQLVQPVLSLIWSALFLGEHIAYESICASVLVIAVAAFAMSLRTGSG